MKIALLLGLVLGFGALLIIGALTGQRESITAKQSPAAGEMPRQATISEPDSTASEAGAETATATSGQQQMPTTQSACAALEQRLLDDLDDAQQELRRAEKEYDDALESYDAALSAREQDEAYLQALRDRRDAAKEAREEAQKDVNGAQKRLTNARIECGLFDEQ